MMVIVVLFCSALGSNVSQAFAQTSCANQAGIITSTANQTSCTSSQDIKAASDPVRGSDNPFPYGSCTRWASQRYYQLSGIYVPWATQANAWQWSARAQEFGWNVSSQPSLGAIVNLQPWVQGAYAYGHVAVVEEVLPNGHVLASNMNWGYYPWNVTLVEFAPAQGVSFITF
jgi:surface antigen